MYELSEGLLEKIMNGEDHDNKDLIFQVLTIKKTINFTSRDRVDRYRLELSDGVTTNNFIILPTPFNYMVKSYMLTARSIIKINQYTLSRITHNGINRRAMMIDDMELIVAGYNVRRIFGDIAVTVLEEQMDCMDI